MKPICIDFTIYVINNARDIFKKDEQIEAPNDHSHEPDISVSTLHYHGNIPCYILQYTLSMSTQQ